MSTYYYYPVADPQFHNYDILAGIYQNLLNTFNQYQPTYNLQVKSTINQDIVDKLANIKKLEQEITDSLVNAELKEKLRVASRGVIDPNRIPDEALPVLLQKHSNLLGLTSTYNNRVKELTDTLSKINNVLIDGSSYIAGPISVSLRVPLDTQSQIQAPSVPWGPTGTSGYPVLAPYTIF